MSFHPRLAALWRNLTQRARVERELDDELRATLDLLVTETMRRGMSPEEARRAAALELGGLDLVKEQGRDGALGIVQGERALARLEHGHDPEGGDEGWGSRDHADITPGEEPTKKGEGE